MNPRMLFLTYIITKYDYHKSYNVSHTMIRHNYLKNTYGLIFVFNLSHMISRLDFFSEIIDILYSNFMDIQDHITFEMYYSVST